MMLWPWLGLLGLGAVHGLNPGMGWLFAVALGLQQGSGRAVWRALLPLAAGHAVAIGVVVTLAAAMGLVLPAGSVRWIVALCLFTLGTLQFVRHAHPRYGGMRVNGRQLTVWSFLMATAHGAGLMALPFVLGAEAGRAAHGAHAAHGTSLGGGAAIGIYGTAVHTAGYVAVTGVLAWLVYRWVGLGVLRTAWVNIDKLWAGALVVTAIATVVV